MRMVTNYRGRAKVVFARRFRQNGCASRLAAAAVLSNALVLSACSDLKPIAEFGKNGSAVAGYPEVAKDYVLSLQRQRSYGQAGTSVSDEKIAERTRQAKRLRDAQAVLEAYAKALGSLAADDLISYDKEIDALNKSLVSGKFATSAQIDGYAKAAKFTLGFVTDIYRREKIKRIIITYNLSVQKATAQLVKIVETDYLTALDVERVMFTQTVVDRARRSTADLEGMPQLVTLLSDEHREMFKTREANAKALAQGMRTFAKGHQELANNIGKVDFKQTIEVARKYADQLKAVIKSFNS